MFFKLKFWQRIWHTIISICAVVSSIYIPLRLVLNLNDHKTLLLFDWIITIIFFLDIFFNFFLTKKIKNNSQWIEKEDFEYNNLTWFLVDLISAIPFGLIFGLSTLNLLRLIKLARVAQYMLLLRQRILRFINTLSLFFFAFWILILTHWFACGWIALHNFNGSNNLSVYLSSLYWCIQTFTTVGYGDITPTTNIQLIYSMILMLFGVGVYGYLIGNVASILTKKDPAKAQFFNNMDSLKAFSNYRDIPDELQKRIRDYYFYIWKKRLGYDEKSFMENLPSGLKNEISLFLKKDILKKIPLFKGIDDKFIKEMSLHLRPLVFTPGDYIFKEGDKGNEMYFIIRGKLEVVSKEGSEVYNTLSDGEFFGEIALFKNVNRIAGVRAVTFSDLYVLDKKVFDYVLNQYPEIANQIKNIVEARLKTSNQI